ncbi:hypothetical protein [Acinetobacter sp. Ver3]|uniref:hypothetical protein n=1 Tax=Acinetobacter sp. Ver3 TaxID=466088 RepID=UPI000452E816|nr:hypothetical protein [Acinetobacter sp. Ver3]EZQ11649.1 hypothetical protein CL42_04110 [Acinetobacter sp. Ver3]
MKVEIISHDHLAIDADLEVVPRIGEIFSGTNENGDEVSGTVRDVEHSYNAVKREHHIRVFLKS